MPHTAKLREAGLTATGVLWLVALLSMLQPLATDLYLPTLPGLAAAFRTDVTTVQLTLSVFVGTFALWQLIAGPLSDRFGRRPIILGGVALFFGASVICMTAQSIGVLVAGRLLQGASGGAMLIFQIAVLSHQFREGRERGRAFGIWGIVFGIGLGFGPRRRWRHRCGIRTLCRCTKWEK